MGYFSVVSTKTKVRETWIYTKIILWWTDMGRVYYLLKDMYLKYEFLCDEFHSHIFLIHGYPRLVLK